MSWEETIKHLDDAMSVMAAMEVRQSRTLELHREWLESHTLAMAYVDERAKEHADAVRAADARLERLDRRLDEIIEHLDMHIAATAELRAAQLVTERKLQALLDALLRGTGNGGGQS